MPMTPFFTWIFPLCLFETWNCVFSVREACRSLYTSFVFSVVHFTDSMSWNTGVESYRKWPSLVLVPPLIYLQPLGLIPQLGETRMSSSDGEGCCSHSLVVRGMEKAGVKFVLNFSNPRWICTAKTISKYRGSQIILPSLWPHEASELGQQLCLPCRDHGYGGGGRSMYKPEQIKDLQNHQTSWSFSTEFHITYAWTCTSGNPKFLAFSLWKNIAPFLT